MIPEAKGGRVVAVCKSPNHGYPTYPQERVVVGPQGIDGDAHSGPMRASFTNPGTQKPNDRPISLVAQEVIDELNHRFHLDIQDGDFNEQIKVRDIGDLSDTQIGDRVIFGSGVILEVTDHAFPCQRLQAHNNSSLLIGALTGRRESGEIFTRRGILTRVLESGELTPGVKVHIERSTPV